MELSLSQQVALQNLKASENIFLTGAPGTGKSFLIRHYLSQLDVQPPILASTGAAAILVGGRTFHSFFALGIMQGGPEAVFEKAMKNARLKRRLRKTGTIIIDEVSMLSHETFDCAERIAREVLQRNEAWGGIRVIAVGDFAQLPPVSRGPQKQWAFLGEAWARSNFSIETLKEVKRTEESEFLKILHQVRLGQFSSEIEAFLNARTTDEIEADVPHIFPRRAQTYAFNKQRLESLPGAMKVYQTKYYGDDRYLQSLERDAPIPAILELKENALVMIRMNDPKQRYVNGTVGRVHGLYEDRIAIDIGHRIIDLEPFCFTLQDADGNEVASATNFPISLAYANTIHKTQGATMDRVHLDLKNLWEPGQAYVAMSRVKSADGLSIAQWSANSFQSDPMVREFYEKSGSQLRALGFH